MKAALSQLPAKSEQAEYSLYGYQSQTFPNRFVSKDQLQQQLCKNESKPPSDDRKPSPKPPVTSKDSKPSPRLSGSRPGGASNAQPSYSSQLIQEGLIPNPVYTNVSSAAAAGSNTSSSISALVNMSRSVGGSPTANEQALPAKPDAASLTRSKLVPGEALAGLGMLPSAAASTDREPGQASQPLIMKSFKSYVENAVTQAFYKDIEEQRKKNSGTADTPAAVKVEKSNGVNDTDSDTLSAPSPTHSLKNDSQDSKPYHPKLKKEWLQRHSGEGHGPSSSSPNSLVGSAVNGGSNASNLSETTTSASETEADQNTVSTG